MTNQHPIPSGSALSMLLVLVIANFGLQPLTEPDFGWHLRTGLDLLEWGGRMPAFDPYSHTLPDWPWVEHAWLTDLVIGLLYQAGGSAGALAVILFFAVITASAWIIASQCSRATVPARLLACALSLWVALPFLGARTQMVTLLGLATLMWVLQRLEEGQRPVVWLIPPLFLVWANLHGGFTAGLFLLGLVIGLAWILSVVGKVWPVAQQSATSVAGFNGALIVATGVGALLTLVNPYGWRLYQEILESLSDRFMIETLQEWHPVSAETLAGRLFAIYLIGLGSAMICWYRRVEPVRWSILAVFLVLACRHLRNIPLFLILSLPLMADMLQEAFDRARVLPVLRDVRPSRGIGVLTVALGMFLLYLGPEHLRSVWHFGVQPATAFRQTSYPIEAVEWLQAHQTRLGTRPIHDYQYGGFLLWWMPHEKVFIDGRMPAWRMGDRQIFREYIDVREADPPNLAVLDKYSIDWALIQRDSSLAHALGSRPAWSREYEDAKVIIFARNNDASASTRYSRTAEEAAGDNVRPMKRSE
jgi:hypothetical protein